MVKETTLKSTLHGDFKLSWSSFIILSQFEHSVLLLSVSSPRILRWKKGENLCSILCILDLWPPLDIPCPRPWALLLVFAEIKLDWSAIISPILVFLFKSMVSAVLSFSAAPLLLLQPSSKKLDSLNTSLPVPAKYTKTLLCPTNNTQALNSLEW